MNNDLINLCVTCYKAILVDKKPFYECISDYIYSSKYEKKDKSNMISIIGATIRHHFFYKKTLSKLYKWENADTFYYLSCCLTDIYFTKRFSQKEIFDYASSYLKAFEPHYDVNELIKFVQNNTPSQILNSEMNSSSSNAYLSIRFNIPEWIIDLWTKQYSRSICIKTITGLASKQKQFIKINPFLDFNGMTLPVEEFRPSNFDPEVFEYLGSEQPRHNPLILKNRIYVTNEIENELIKKIKLNYADNIVYYFYEKNNFHIDLMNAYKEKSTIGFFSADFQKTSKALEYIKRFQNTKIYYDQASTADLNSRVLKSTNLFILFPRSSNFNYVNSSPEYLLNFDGRELDRIIMKEKEDLLNCSKLVIMGGYLVYFTHTMNKKENSELIKEFLENNKNYNLICEKEFLLSNKDSIFGYYAVLTRVF
jgi:hypothetical protein